MDYIHSFTNWLSYNRWSVLALLLSFCFVILPSCSFTATGPDGTKKDKAALITDLETREREVKTALEAAAREKARAEALAGREKDASLRAVAERYEETVASVTENYQIQHAKMVDELETYTAKTADAVEKIQAKEEVLKNVFGVVDGLMTSLGPALGPAGNTAWGLVSTLLAGGIFVDNRRKDKKIKELQSEKS